MNETGKGRSEYLPYILIGAGVLVLLANIGWFSVGGLLSGLFSVLQLWPVALIAVGADMLTQGKHRAVVIAVALVVGAALFLTNGVTNLFGGGTPKVEQVAVPLQGASSARVRLSSGVGDVFIAAAPGSQEAVSGEVQLAARERLRQSTQFRNGVLDVEIASRTNGLGTISFGGRGGEWDLRLSDRVPVELEFDGGVGESRLDLRGLNLTEVEIDAGVGNVELTLPAAGAYRVDIDAGVGQLVVRVPAGASVRLAVSTGLGGVSTTGGFERSGNDVYLSPGYDARVPTAEVSIDGGVGAIRFEVVQ